MSRSEYQQAIEQFERVLETLKYFPYPIDKTGFKAHVEGKLKEAKDKEVQRDTQEKKAMQDLALQNSQVLESRNEAYLRARVKTLFEQAETAYDRTDYALALRLAGQVIDLDPSFTLAYKLRERAENARRFKAEVTAIEDETEGMKRLIEGVYEAAIPYQEIFQFPSPREWAAVEKRAVDLENMFERKGHVESPEEQRIKATLETRRVTINFQNTSFEDALQFLREITGLNYYVAPTAADALTDLKITLRLKDITLKNALELILGQGKDLVYRVKSDAIEINTKDAVKEDLFLRFYEVSDITATLPDNKAPELALTPSGNKGAGGQGAGAILNLGSDEGNKVGTQIEPDKLKELIEQKLGSDTGGSVEYLSGVMMVRKTLADHKKIERLLESLRRAVGIMVTVETKIVDVQDNFLEELGIDFRGLPAVISNPLGPGTTAQSIGFNFTNAAQSKDFRGAMQNIFAEPLGSNSATPFRFTNSGGGGFQYNFLEKFQLQGILEAVKKKQKARLVDAPRVTVFNGQRSHVLSIRERAYIKGLEVNQTGVTPTINPIIGILDSGSVLEARPIVSYDRKFVTLEIQPTLARDLTAPGDSSRLVLAQGNTDITVQLPVVSLERIRSTVMVPDGGTVIIGGLKNYVDQEEMAGLPIVRHVPLLHNLFEKKGNAELKRSLVVRLKVDITIARERDVIEHNKQPLQPTAK